MREQAISVLGSNVTGLAGVLGFFALGLAVQFVEPVSPSTVAPSAEYGRTVLADFWRFAPTFALGLTGVASFWTVVGHLATRDLCDFKFILPTLPVAFVVSMFAGLSVPDSPDVLSLNEVFMAADVSIIFLTLLAVVVGTTRYGWRIILSLAST